VFKHCHTSTSTQSSSDPPNATWTDLWREPNQPKRATTAATGWVVGRPADTRYRVTRGDNHNRRTWASPIPAPRAVAVAGTKRVVSGLVEQRPLGLSGLEVSRLGLGTMTWGTGSDFDTEDAATQLTTFTEAGGTLVDTADVYGQGAAEAVLGELLDKVVPRIDVHIATKAGVVAQGQRRRNTSRGHLLSALDASLARLGTDYVDLWQLHVNDPDTPMEETLATLDMAITSGRARYVGLSNHTGWQTGRAVSWQRAWPGRAPIVAAQVEYSLVQRGIEREVLPACLAMDVGILAWSPLGRGVLTGKYRFGRPSDSRASSPQWSRFVSSYLDDRSAGIVEAVATAADGLGVTPLDVALAWVRDQPGVTCAVVGARNAAQLRSALMAEAVFLPPEIRLALADVSAPDPGYPESH